MNEIGNTIKEIRKERKLTRRELGEMMGIKARTIEGWENGPNNPKAADIPALCKALRITPNQLYNWKGANKNVEV